jgi:type IV pilus assembly protein PilA
MKTMKQGFSLIELLVVVAIIGILAAVGTVGYQNYIDGTRTRVAESNAETVANALQAESLRAASGIDGGCDTITDCVTGANALFDDFENPYSTASGAYITVGTASCTGTTDSGKIYIDGGAGDTDVDVCDQAGTSSDTVKTVDLTDLPAS